MGIYWIFSRSMNFDDSLFEDSSKEVDKRVDASQIKYDAKRCKLNWFTEPHDDNDGGFMLIKYRADLLYLQKQYSAAVPGYEASLRSVPPSNGVVVRELTESLARCWLHLERPWLALEKACLLVQPPHENDSSAWKLIGDCQGALTQTEAQVVSLQKCTLKQRYQFNYWTSLSVAYGDLSQQFSSEGLADRENIDWTELGSIMETTVTLFRPYFSWVSLTDKLTTTTPISEETIPKDESSIGFSCHKCCVLNGNHCSYTDAVLEMASKKYLCVSFKTGSSLCLPHHPFTTLNSGSASVADFVTAMERLYSCGHPGLAGELMNSFLCMSKCACLLWARQLLFYFVRYSHSFVVPAHKTALGKADQQLLACDHNTRHFLETYFNKNRIFQESQNKDEKQ